MYMYACYVLTATQLFKTSNLSTQKIDLHETTVQVSHDVDGRYSTCMYTCFKPKLSAHFDVLGRVGRYFTL